MRTWLVQKAYARDIGKWAERGWQPTRNGAGEVVVHPSPTGTQTWVVRHPPEPARGVFDFID